MEAPAVSLSPEETVRQIRAAMPAESLFADKEWLVSPQPFFISPALAEQIEKLGPRLHLFVRACNLLYHQSVNGKQPAWIADYLDRGKPPELVEFSRRRPFRDELPAVIRPDLILTDEGFTIAELDNVPGGIGLTAWLNQTYAALGHDVLGGARGMIHTFLAAVGPATIVISDESATYRPEMQWLAGESDGALRVVDASEFHPETSAPGHSIFRFFELFDLPNVPCAAALMAAAGETLRVTPPFKPYLEEKMWFALFWLRPLREFWRRELSERHFLELQKHIPYTWILDPAPLPPHAVLPGLEIQDWSELAHFSQKERELILKISGFSELGWGSRGVVLGSDVPQGEWEAALRDALKAFPHHPHILQRFHKARLVEQPFWNPATGAVESMRGRVRLCPYYFLHENRAHLSGALATICPADKKLLHGMRDAIMAPTSVFTP